MPIQNYFFDEKINNEKVFIAVSAKHKTMLIEDYFDESTMSVHLRENSFPIAKKGFPGNWKSHKIDDKRLTKEQVVAIYEEIMEVVELEVFSDYV